MFVGTLLVMLIVLVGVMLATVLILNVSQRVGGLAENEGSEGTTSFDIIVDNDKNTQKTPSTTSKSPNTTPSTSESVQTTVVTTVGSTTTESQGSDKPVTGKRVAITFDDGPNGNLTKLFVDKLDEYGATATFFVVGDRVGWSSNKEAIKYVYTHGHEIGIHSQTHEIYYDSCTMETYLSDMKQTENSIKAQVPGVNVTLMRPPGGRLTAKKRDACPYSVIMWSVDSEDWKHTGTSAGNKEKNVQAIVDNVMSGVKDGDIILMHELYRNSYDAFCIIIDQLYEQGYEVVSIGELYGSELVAGKTYYSKK